MHVCLYLFLPWLFAFMLSTPSVLLFYFGFERHASLVGLALCFFLNVGLALLLSPYCWPRPHAPPTHPPHQYKREIGHRVFEQSGHKKKATLFFFRTPLYAIF